MINFKSIKTQMILYLAAFALFLSVKDKDSAFFMAVIVAVISAFAADLIIPYFKTKTLQVSESAVITGLIIGFVLSAGEPLWKFALVSFLAVASKHLIRFKGKHIFNPAAFGLFLLIVFGAVTQWRGTYLWYIVVPFGFYFTYKIRKIELIAGYAVITALLFGGQAILQKAPVWNVFGYLSYFYIFVMAIEPKTTPVKPVGKFLFGAGLAGLIFILTQFGARFDVELFSLLLMNMPVQVLNKIGGRA